MNGELRPLNEINEKAIKFLIDKIGFYDTVRFINQFSIGSGNYTEERKTLYRDVYLDSIILDIKKNRAKK
ncbi:MAG: hypothetical protein KJ666_18100 [Bacteroidetes bacterium]|nr:hypothetical protein [Bacteroidota bacterium]MBU2583711.1 hypothetical protein [Bacteroidota bacterium]